MKRFKPLFAAASLSIFLFAACKKENSNINPNAINQTAGTLNNQSLVAATVSEKLDSLKATLPLEYAKRVQKNAAVLSPMHSQYSDIVQQVIGAGSPAACNANTSLVQLLTKQTADWTNDITFFANVTGMLNFPTYDALLFENTPADQSFGINGEYTHILNKTFKDLQRFWNIQTDNIVLAAMHGSMLRDRDKLIRIDMVLYGESQAQAASTADLILALLKNVPQYKNGDHPIFTFNSFAQNGFAFPPYGNIPPKIVMGDGILGDFTSIGFGDVAPQAILAHEFGHQVQFQLGLFGNTSSPEATRRTELMADAYSAYYLSHARGAAMQWKRVQQFMQVFFNIGDCQVTSINHHGTPTQRMAAANWGYGIANNAQKQGQILTSQQFTAMFEAQLPVILSN
jgi:hypothetical protein